LNLEELFALLPEEEQKKFLPLIESLRQAEEREAGQIDFLSFVKSMWPGFIYGRHHALMAQKFEDIANGKSKRLIINMPPRHTKSEFASYLLPAWYLGKYPNKKIIQCSNTAELAVGFGRKVRNLVDGEDYSKIFPNVSLRSDSKAAGRWSTNANGEYFAIGVGGTVTGKGADLLIIDDPHSEQEAALASSDPAVFDKVFEWYTSGPRQRLQPGGSIVVVMCMTGDTPVLMADKTKKLLRDICVGDQVATFEKGNLTSAKINNFKSNGFDTIYKVQTQSGKIIRANARHPFLVDNHGVLEWTRLKHLKLGDELVSLKDAIGLQEQKQNQVNVDHAKQKTAITEKTLTLRIIQLGIMENGLAKYVLNKAVMSLFTAIKSAKNIIVKRIGHLVLEDSLQKKEERIESKVVMESQLVNLTIWLKRGGTSAIFAIKSLTQETLAPIGMAGYVSTTAMKQEKSEDCCATTATLPLDMQKQSKLRSQLHLISDFTTDPIVQILHDGQEEVFDVEVDRTENFIANGFVSHNTRWAKRDLTGKICKSIIDRDGEVWDMISLPAILPTGKPLWPEFWSLKELENLREELPLPKWQAQYQQDPTSEEGALVKRE
jgi:hypothetical protein